jgi:hypothetical protein
MIATGEKHNKYQKTFVEVFHVNIEDLQSKLDEWIKEKEKEDFEIDDIKLSSDCQSKAVALVIYRRIDASKTA